MQPLCRVAPEARWLFQKIADACNDVGIGRTKQEGCCHGLFMYYENRDATAPNGRRWSAHGGSLTDFLCWSKAGRDFYETADQWQLPSSSTGLLGSKARTRPKKNGFWSLGYAARGEAEYNPARDVYNTVVNNYNLPLDLGDSVPELEVELPAWPEHSTEGGIHESSGTAARFYGSCAISGSRDACFASSGRSGAVSSVPRGGSAVTNFFSDGDYSAYSENKSGTQKAVSLTVNLEDSSSTISYARTEKTVSGAYASSKGHSAAFAYDGDSFNGKVTHKSGLTLAATKDSKSLAPGQMGNPYWLASMRQQGP
ncbi:unnamed protein product [Durusdinium trenchii]|uniref:Uncharacterized protein n=1 Tax=Durusdinium trenchii TaxID=1381693 RepID=A0ABP0N9Y8_9DINO